jgi:hypothetical protein
MKLPLTIILLMFSASLAFTQTTYVQTTATCTERSCTNAQFTPAATFSYNVNLQTCGGSFSGAANWNGNQYLDFVGTYKWLGYFRYPYNGKYLLQGTFDGGRYTVSETFETGFRSCSAIANLSGTVVGS